MPVIEKGIMKIVPKDFIVKLEPGESFEIEHGYHSGNSKVYLDTLANLTPASAEGNDVLTGYFGWKNAVRISGSIYERNEITECNAVELLENNKINIYFQRGAYINKNQQDNAPLISIRNSELTSALKMTADMFPAGKMVGNIIGTFTSDANATEDDIIYGEIGYVRGKRVVGKLKTTDIQAVSILELVDGIITISWNNPMVGPYQGTCIKASIDGAEKVELYKGTGSNSSPGGRSSINLSDLKPGTYRFYVYSYCGTLMNGKTFEQEFVIG